MPIEFTDNAAFDGMIEEMAPSPSENLGSDGVSASVELKVPFDQRWAILDDIVGNLRAYPYAPSSGAAALSGSAQPFGASDADGSGLTYDEAILTINYGQQSGQSISGGGITYAESINASAELINLDHTKFQWGASGPALQPAEAPGRLITGFDYVQKQYKLASVPSTVLSEIGKVNATSKIAAILGLIFPAQSMLYVTPQLERSINTAGTGTWDVTTTFSIRYNGWNKFWRAESGAWEAIHIKGGSQYNNFPTTSSLPVI